MKNIFYVLSSLVIIALISISCDKDSEALQQEEVSLKAQQPKVTICHYDADLDESYQITISVNGLNGHYGHEFDEIPELNTDGEAYGDLVDSDEDGIVDCADCYPGDETKGEKMTWYRDADGDGFGDPNVYIETCLTREGYVADNTDCDDTTAAILGEYIFEWNAPGGYKHHIIINNFDPVDASFTGFGHFIFISHSSTSAEGDEPLTISGTIDIDAQTFTGVLDYDNAGVHPFSGSISACGELTGGNILIYPYIDNDGDGYSFDEGDCDDDDGALNPGATEVCDGIDNNCDGNIDEGVIYSPVGTFVAEYSGGFQWDIEITSFDGLTGDFEGVANYPAGAVVYTYTDKVIENGNVNLATGAFTGKLNHPPNPDFNGTVSSCGGVTSMSGNWTLIP